MSAAQGSVSDPSGRTPLRGVRLGAGRDSYIEALTDDEIVGMFRVGQMLRLVVQQRANRAGAVTLAQRKRSAAEAKRLGWSHLPALLAVTEARRPKLSSMLDWADKAGIPAEVIEQIAARFPAGIAPE